MGYRVVQWTTGNVGRRSIQAIVANPDLELVGIKATRDVSALLSLEPDWPDAGDPERRRQAQL